MGLSDGLEGLAVDGVRTFDVPLTTGLAAQCCQYDVTVGLPSAPGWEGAH